MKQLVEANESKGDGDGRVFIFERHSIAIVDFSNCSTSVNLICGVWPEP